MWIYSIQVSVANGAKISGRFSFCASRHTRAAVLCWTLISFNIDLRVMNHWIFLSPNTDLVFELKRPEPTVLRLIPLSRPDFHQKIIKLKSVDLTKKVKFFEYIKNNSQIKLLVTMIDLVTCFMWNNQNVENIKCFLSYTWKRVKKCREYAPLG